MPDIVQGECRNRLLSLMSPEDFARLSPDLFYSDLPRGHLLVEAGAEIEVLHFPEAAIASVLATTGQGEECEAGLFGVDGVGPYSALLGVRTSAHRVIIQVPNGSHGITYEAALAAMRESPSLSALLLRFVHVMYLQTSLTALMNATDVVDQRLARWILMCHDRSASDDIALTHEFLSIMLAVRRPSVTTSLHILEGHGLIRSERGSLTVRNRVALEAYAGTAYGQPEAEYARLIGPMRAA